MTLLGAAIAAAAISIVAAWHWRSRLRLGWPRKRAAAPRALSSVSVPALPAVIERPRVRVRTSRSAGGAGLAVTQTTVACPSCRREYEGAVYCSRDARRLVPTHEMNHPRSQGVVCMACRRAFEPGIRRCPHDGTALVPFAVYAATRPRSHTLEPAGVIARICPVCASRYDLHARFCGVDGSELVVIN
jgi:hypothetical protein